MAILSTLPNELLARIVTFLDKPALAHTRLVNKRFEQLSVEKLFERVSLYAHWMKESLDEEETYSVDTVVDTRWHPMYVGKIDEIVGDVGRMGEDEGGGDGEIGDAFRYEGHEEWTADGMDGDEVEEAEQIRGHDANLIRDVDNVEVQDNYSEEAAEDLSRREFRRELRGRKRELEAGIAESLRNETVEEVEEDDPWWFGALDQHRDADEHEEGRKRGVEFWDEEDEEPYPRTAVPHERERSSERDEVEEMHHDTAGWSTRSDSEIRATEELQFLHGREFRRRGNPWDRNRPQWAADGFPGPPGYDANKFKNILQHVEFKKYVKEVQVYTCETDCDHHPAYETAWFIQEWPSPYFDPVYHECIKRLDELPNMRSLTVHFDRHAGDEDDIFQKKGFQRRWLRRIIKSTNERATKLAVRHYENFWEPSSEAPLFIENVANVTSLRMSIKHQETSHNAGPTYRCGNIHEFWDRFSDQFLKPPQANLTTLILYSDLPLGWFPKLDLSGVHFPKLHSLTLGHHIFHHEHQVEWIISHSSTLKELYLDQCSILYQIGYSIPGWLDEEGYPRAIPPGGVAADYGWSCGPEHGDHQEFARDLQFTSISIRWHDIFPRFANKLHNLHTFKFGSSKQWKMDTASRYILQWFHSHALPIMPWEDEHNIKNRILESRYVVWDDWENDYRPHWTSNTATDVWKEMDKEWRQEWKDRLEVYPDCKKEDEGALQALLERVRGQ